MSDPQPSREPAGIGIPTVHDVALISDVRPAECMADFMCDDYSRRICWGFDLCPMKLLVLFQEPRVSTELRERDGNGASNIT